MFNIVICLSDKNKSAFISSEIKGYLVSRRILFSISSYHSANEMLHQDSKSFVPDTLILDSGDEIYNQVLKFALKLKQKYKHLVFLNIGDLDLDSYPFIENLNPIIPVSVNDTKGLLNHLGSIYENNYRDNKNFSFYIRPSLLSFPLNEIMYFSSDGRKIHLISTNSYNTCFYNKLDCVEKQIMMKKCRFVRIHKSYLVNSKYISSYTKNDLTLSDGTCLTISKYQYFLNVKKIIK